MVQEGRELDLQPSRSCSRQHSVGRDEEDGPKALSLVSSKTGYESSHRILLSHLGAPWDKETGKCS